jgi:hypothetical protein
MRAGPFDLAVRKNLSPSRDSALIVHDRKRLLAASTR